MKTNLFILFLMITSVSFAQVYEDFDTNSDDTVDREEFNQGYGNNFSQWDRNQDGTLDDREFYETTFNRMDEDGDGMLSQNEWENGYDNLYSDYVGTSDYSLYDEDGDEMISSEEFYMGMSDSDYYNTYDTNRDGSIDQTELSDTVFDTWDENGDGVIDRTEYDSYSAYYIDF